MGGGVVCAGRGMCQDSVWGTIRVGDWRGWVVLWGCAGRCLGDGYGVCVNGLGGGRW